mgnify:CR=1 FL=1
MVFKKIEELRQSLAPENRQKLVEPLADLLKQIGSILEEHEARITELEQELKRLKK